MALHHIIPKFILKGFTINPKAERNEQEIMIYDTSSKKTYIEKINTAYAKEDFNSEQTEKYLCNGYENNVAKIFQRIKKRAEDNEKDVALSNEEYKLLFKFFTIMWRRNDIHIEKGRNIITKIETELKNIFGENYEKMKSEKYKDISLEEYYTNNETELGQKLYDKLISSTNDNSESVLKNIKNYIPIIVHNKSNIHFILHNTYGTMDYIVKKESYEVNEFDFPITIIEPISNNLCFCLMFCNDKIDLDKKEYKIKIEYWDNDEQIKQFFINGYITPQATSFVVDDTNIKYLKGE
jgi:hypothetical protein